MRILIVSDTHRKNENYLALLKKWKNVDMVIHCGDVEGSEYVISESAQCPVYMVSGNNDFFSGLPREQEISIGKYKVWVTHGHHYLVSMGPERIMQEAEARGIDIVMFGHTHRPLLIQEDGVIALNPGSLSYPRQEGHRPSYAIMELDKNGEAHFTLSYLK